ncbi:hypothetical protein MVEN_02447000 [Mycena venus]|uniref:Uncharacterized protein n=1 Tax=Mycena venus TaxID=2733690 RepID=A0A8H6WYK2_9AGAR|nr:hypothetical protein MVEN_02447000 [Mycena venus]
MGPSSVHSEIYPARNNNDWKTCVRLDGSQYHSKTKTGGNSCVLVVDHWRHKAMAEEQENSVSSCEEAYFSGENQWLFIFHSSQTAWYPTQRNDADMKTKQKLYWSYIVAHPAHAERSIAEWMSKAHQQALMYLKWCSFESLTSSRAKTPFPLKHSEDLAHLLNSLNEGCLNEEARPEHAQACKKVFPVDPRAGGSQSIPDIPHEEDIKSEEKNHEGFKLRVTLVAKVLMEKYSQQGAVEAMSETNQPPKPSKVLDVLFGIVDVASLGSFLRYLNRLDEVRDTLLTNDQWRDHIMRLVKEWEEFNLISTVLLSASAGILALENIGGVPRTAILISVLSSFGSITTGLYCITMYQPRAPNSRDSVDRTSALTIFNYTQYTLTHKTIAMVLGLPMAFLVWSLVSFMVGILSFNIVGTKISGHVSGVAYAVISVAAIIFLLIALAFYSLAKLWGSGRGHSLLGAIRRQYMKIVRHWRPLSENEKSLP